MNALEWEDIDSTTMRAKVIGGWLVKTSEPVYHLMNAVHAGGSGWDCRISMCFVPDEGYYWGSEDYKR